MEKFKYIEEIWMEIKSLFIKYSVYFPSRLQRVISITCETV